MIMNGRILRMTSARIAHAAGFTLAELLVVVAMMGFFMAAVFSLYQTHQRSAYTQEEVADVQQNLRIAMNRLADDIRMAGFLVPAGTNPLAVAGLTTLTINTASASSTTARVTSPVPAVTLNPGDSVSLSIDDLGGLTVNDQVRIISAPAKTLSVPAQLTVTLVNSTGTCGAPPVPAPCLTVRNDGGATVTGAIAAGDIIARTGGAYPNTVVYSLVTNAVDANCPAGAGQSCLQRTTDDGGGSQIIAQNITNLQLGYILDGGTEVSPPAATEMALIRGIRVTLTGQTVTTTAYTGGTAKNRSLTSIVHPRNRAEGT